MQTASRRENKMYGDKIENMTLLREFRMENIFSKHDSFDLVTRTKAIYIIERHRENEALQRICVIHNASNDMKCHLSPAAFCK